jgi:hypothetical protein
MPEGSPQLTPTWVDTDGEHILINLINTFEGSQKVRLECTDHSARCTQRSRETSIAA